MMFLHPQWLGLLAVPVILAFWEWVRRGQPIALAGHSGNATGDHVHFEVRWKGGTVNPRTVLPLLSGSTSR